MASTRERVINTVFPNRGAIANAAAAMRDTRARARDRAEVERALLASRFAAPDQRRPTAR